MAVFELLKQEHERIGGLLRTLTAEGRKGGAFEQLRVHLELHMQGEEEHVYPELRTVGLQEEMLRALEEHHIIKILLGELQDMSGGEEAWLPKSKVLVEQVEHHLGQEQSKVFPLAEVRISRTRQEELEAEYRQFILPAVQAGLPRSQSPFYRWA
jgi:hypothetical protein